MTGLNLRAAIPTLAVALVLASGGHALAQGNNAHAISLYNLGLTAYKQGSPESAIIFFKRACDIDPDLADAQYNLAIIYQMEKRLKEAVPRFQEVLRVRPADSDARFQLGLCFIDMGQPADARPCFGGIAPNDKHFADAQKRISMIDSQTPQIVPAPQSAPQMPAAVNPVMTPPAYTPPVQQQPAVQQQAMVQPQAVQPVQPVQPLAVQPAASAAPIAVMANCSVRVIATGFSAPAGLTFDRTGNLYIANYNSNTIDRISPDGTKSLFSSGPNLKGPIGLTADAGGNIYVANYSAGTVARINPAGISTLIAKDFKKPYYLTLDKEGNLFVSQQEDNSVVRITLPRPIGAKP